MNNKETFKKSGVYKWYGYSKGSKMHIVWNDVKENFELWFANKNHAGHGLIYKNTHLEYARDAQFRGGILQNG